MRNGPGDDLRRGRIDRRPSGRDRHPHVRLADRHHGVPLANQVSARLDENRMLVTEKVFEFLIAAIAVQLILDGLASAGIIPPIKH